MVERIEHENRLLGIIIRRNYTKNGIEFFTDNNSSQQLGYMKRPKGYEIIPHRHNFVSRNVGLTQEVLFIKSGLVRVDFYSEQEDYVQSKVLYPLDVILLSQGGHGFHFLEISEIIEVKQGPYIEDRDKIRFNAKHNNHINIK